MPSDPPITITPPPDYNTGEPPYVPGAEPTKPLPTGPSVPPGYPGSPWPDTPSGWAGYYAYMAGQTGNTGYSGKSSGGGGGGRRGGGGGGGGGGASNAKRAKVLAAEIADRAKQLGLSFTDKEIANIAKWAVKDNWSQTVIDDALLIGVDWHKVTGGDLTAGVDLVKSIGANYLIPVSQTQAQNWSLRIAKGELTQQGIQSMLQSQARARWSWMGDLIDQGIKPSDYFAPVQNMIAQTLEVAPDSVNLMDPKWIGMVEVRDPKSGQTRAATLNEAMLAARQKPEWQNTRQAQEYATQVGQMLGNIFGRSAA